MLKKKLPDLDDQVARYMDTLDHPLKKEAQALRQIINQANTRLTERIKWNAPSYYYQEDLLTFNFHDKKTIRLVFHHPAIVKIKSALLEGDYKDRRLVYLSDMASVKAGKKELSRIINELVEAMDKR